MSPPSSTIRLCNILLSDTSVIFKSSFTQSKLPEKWKMANIKPLFKKGRKTDRFNYRSICLNAIPSKVMEKLVKAVIVKHLDNNKLLSTQQHGFTKNKSCTTNILKALDTMNDALY